MRVHITFVLCTLMLSVYPDVDRPNPLQALGTQLVNGGATDDMKLTAAYICDLVNAEDRPKRQQEKGSVVNIAFMSFSSEVFWKAYLYDNVGQKHRFLELLTVFASQLKVELVDLLEVNNKQCR